MRSVARYFGIVKLSGGRFILISNYSTRSGSGTVVMGIMFVFGGYFLSMCDWVRIED